MSGSAPVRLGPFELLDELGRGGMGVVHRARDLRSGRPVALKLLHAGLENAAQRERFLREGRAAGRLSRQVGIVPLLEVGEVEGRPYLAFELLEGQSLEALLRRAGPLDPQVAARLIHGLARALAHAHAQGVLHRDVKPSNVLLDGAGRPWLADFGLARASDELDRLTRSGQLLGTPGYMAPEQARGEQVGPAADVHGLGATLYALLTGVPPYRGVTPLEVLSALALGRARPPSQLRPGLPPALDEVCLRCLERDPDRRYASAALLAEDLERFLAGRPLLSAELPPARRAALRRGWPLLAAALVVLVCLAGGLLRWRHRPQASAPPSFGGGGPSAAAVASPLVAGQEVAAGDDGLSGPAHAARTHLGRAEALLRAGQLDQALASFDAALSEDPQLGSAWSGRGRVKEKLGDLPGALEDHDRAVALDPRDPDALFARARARGKGGDLRGGIDDYTRLLELDPSDARSFTNRGDLRLQAGDLEAARQDMDQALALDPGALLAWQGRGSVRLRQRDFAGAVEDYGRALALDPRSAPAHGNRAAAKKALGDLSGALADYDRAIALDPTRGDLFFNRGNARVAARDPAGAIEDYTAALRLDPRDHMALGARAEARREAGDLRGAIADLEQALLLVGPGSQPAQRWRQRRDSLRAALDRQPEGQGAGR